MAKRRLPVFLRGHELDALLAAAEGELDRVLLMTAAYAGLRISEVVKLRVEHIDLEQGVLFVSQGKGDKDRYIPLASKLLGPLRAWIGGRRAGYVFPALRQRSRGHLSQRYAQLMVLATAARAELTKHVTPHKLRHTFATQLLSKGANVREVQELLGHSNLGTTEIYLHCDVDRLRGAVERL